MKKLLLTIGIITMIFQIGAAQKYKVKRRSGAVLKDKKEVARVEGKVSVFKTSYMDMYQNDELVLSLQQNAWKSPYKEFDNFPYYEFVFPQSGEKFNVKANYTFTNEKQIIRHLMAGNGLHIYKDGFKAEEISELKNSEVVTSVEKDTLHFANLLSDWRESIEENAYGFNESKFDKVAVHPIHRDPKKRPKNLPDGITHLVYREISNKDIINNYEAERKSIYRLVGAVAYKDAEPEIGQTKGTHEIRVFRRVKNFVEYNGKETKYAPIAYTDLNEFGRGLNGSQGGDEYLLYMDGSFHDYVPFQSGTSDAKIGFGKRSKYIVEELKAMGLI
jgi:hypothetical protein